MTYIDIQIKKVADAGDLPLPEYMTAGSAGMDLYAAIREDNVIGSGERTLVPCGFSLAIPEGYEAQIRPRSGLALEHGITVLNSPGTIDSDFRGEVQIILINFGNSAFTIKRGMRVAQIIITPVLRVNWIQVDEIPDTSRGKNGAGHTGK